MAERYLLVDGTAYALLEGSDPDATLAQLVTAVRDGGYVALDVQRDRTPVVLHSTAERWGRSACCPRARSRPACSDGPACPLGAARRDRHGR